MVTLGAQKRNLRTEYYQRWKIMLLKGQKLIWWFDSCWLYTQWWPGYPAHWKKLVSRGSCVAYYYLARDRETPHTMIT
jgi:hypothetical protein